MNEFPIVAAVIALTLIVVLALVVVYWRNRRELPRADYRTFFILGLAWLPLGIATDNPALWGMGAVFFIAGLVNRTKWEEKQE
jgi:hypothetical protein